jgi:hypothetical protein
MQTRMSELRLSALAGGLALLGGVAAWQLGVEFERAWLRSSDGLLAGETLERVSEGAHVDQTPAAGGERRRWVAHERLRLVPGPTRLA